MRVSEAREQARAWVEAEASRAPGFIGAFLTGSTKWKRAADPHLASSDVDVRVIVDRPVVPSERKKALFADILLEAALVPREELGPAEKILPNPHLAGSLWHPIILGDPTGEIAELGRQVTAQFARRRWVEARRRAARDLALFWLGRIDEAPAFPEQVTCWLFGTSVTTLVLLSAGLRNLTVRRRYAESRDLLDDHDRLDFHEEMLGWLGCVELKPERARQHLDALAEAFDATAPHVDASFRFAADLRPDARPIAIEGSRELIDRGLHREAVFWLVSTFSRCLQGLRSDAPERVRAYSDAALRELLRDLGLETRADLKRRAEHVCANLPRLDLVADQIIEATPEITP